LDINKNEVIRNLIKLGAMLRFEGIIRSVFFDTPDNSLDNSRQLLRLRKEGNENVLAYKKKTVENNVRLNREVEVRVEDFDKAKEIFQALGYQEKFAQEKHRTEYSLDNCNIVIDEYRGGLSYIPTFMELECITDKKEAALNKLDECAKKLGFSKNDFRNWTTKELEAHYKPN